MNIFAILMGMSETKTTDALPLPTIQRYPTYLRCIKEMVAAGETHVSSAVVARKLGLDAVLTRKDLAMAGVTGTPRRGYPAHALEQAMNRALGWHDPTDAVLVGVGSLGNALLGYGGFREQNLSIVAAFDADPALSGTTRHGVAIRPVTELARVAKRLRVTLGILTVPPAAAQECADALVSAGIRGVWNFTNVHLDVPDGVVVQSVDLAQSLAVLSHAIGNLRRAKA